MVAIGVTVSCLTSSTVSATRAYLSDPAGATWPSPMTSPLAST